MMDVLHTWPAAAATSIDIARETYTRPLAHSARSTPTREQRDRDEINAERNLWNGHFSERFQVDHGEDYLFMAVHCYRWDMNFS